MDVGSSIIYHLERHLNACLSYAVLRHGTRGLHIQTKDELGVAGFSREITENVICRLRDNDTTLRTGDTKFVIDQKPYDLAADDFDYAQLPKWLLIVTSESDLTVKENISILCRWCRRLRAWQCDCLIVAVGSTAPPSKSHTHGLIKKKITDLCQNNPELRDLRIHHRLRTFHLPHWDSVDTSERDFVSIVRQWINGPPSQIEKQKNDKEHLPYTDIAKILIRDIRILIPNLDIFCRLFLMCFVGVLSVATTLLLLVTVSRGGGVEYDMRKAEEYIISHLEYRRTGKSEWGRSYTPSILTSLQINNPHWCFDKLENQRSVDRLEIGILSMLSSLTAKEAAHYFTPFRLTRDINALLTTFHNPRNFHNHDLVAILKRYVRDVVPYRPYSAHAYSNYVIALCNSGEEPDNVHADRILSKMNDDGSFNLGTDEAAVSLVALSCIHNTDQYATQIDKVLNYLRYQRRHDGSYGSPYSTALVLQAYNITGAPVDTALKLEATLSWLTNRCYDKHALKDPEVASAVLLALSRKTTLSIPKISGADILALDRKTTTGARGKADKFRFLMPDKVEKMTAEHIQLTESVSISDESNSTAQNSSQSVNTDSNKDNYQNTDIIPNDSKQSRGELRQTEQKAHVTVNIDKKSLEHRWKTWKRSALVFDIDTPLYITNYAEKRKQDSNLRFRKYFSDFYSPNENSWEYIVDKKCVLGM